MDEVSTGVSIKKNPKYVRGKNFFFGIAIDEYKFYRKLNNCVKDVTDIRDELVSRYDFEMDSSQILSNNEATQRNILRVLDELYNKVKEDDNLIIFYSGHGVNLFGRNIGFMIPVDAKDEYDFIDLSVIKNRLDTLIAKHIVLIFDSCFSGLILTQRNLNKKNNIPENFPSRFALTSGRNSPVDDGYKGNNSPFTEALLTNLRDNEDKLGIISLSQSVLDFFSSLEKEESQLPDFGIINSSPIYRGQYYFYPKNYEETISRQKKEIVKLKEALEIITKREQELKEALIFAKSQSLAAQALLLQNKDPTIALRLAELSYKILSNKETSSAVSQILGNDKNSFYKKGFDIAQVADTKIYEMAFDIEKQYVLIGRSSQDFSLWDLDENKLKEYDCFEDQEKEGEWITALTFSPTCEYFVFADVTGNLTIRNINGDIINHCKVPHKFKEFSIHTIKFNNNDLCFATADRSNMIIWNSDGTIVSSFSIPSSINDPHNKEKLLDVEFHPNRDQIFSATVDGTVRLWDFDGNCLRVFNCHINQVNKIAIDKKGKYLATCSRGEAKLWEIKDLENHSINRKIEPITSIDIHPAGIQTICFSDDGKNFLTGSNDGKIKLWRLEGELIAIFSDFQFPIQKLAISKDKGFILGGNLQSIKLWKVENKLNQLILPNNEEEVDFSLFAENGKYISTISGLFGQSIKLWDIKGNLLHSFDDLKSENTTIIRKVAFIREDKFMLVGYLDGAVKIIDINRKKLGILKEGEAKKIIILGFGSKADFFVSVEEKTGLIKFFNYEGNNFYKDYWDILVGCKEIEIVVGQKNQRALLVKFEYRVYLISLNNSGDEKVNSESIFDESGIYASCVSKDLNYILTASRHLKTAKILNRHNKAEISIGNSKDRILSVAISPCNKLFVTGHEYGEVNFWDINGYSILSLKLWGHASNIVFSPNGNLLIITISKRAHIFRSPLSILDPENTAQLTDKQKELYKISALQN